MDNLEPHVWMNLIYSIKCIADCCSVSLSEECEEEGNDTDAAALIRSVFQAWHNLKKFFPVEKLMPPKLNLR